MNFKHLERHIGFVLLCLVLGVSYFQGTSQAVEWNNAAHPNEYNFTDYDLTGKPIRLVHFNELRLAMDSTNTACSLGVTLDWPTVFTDNVAVGKPIKASHIARLRANLQSLYTAYNAAHPLAPLSFTAGSSLLETNNADIPGTTIYYQGKVIKKSDIQDMRDAINALRAQCTTTCPNGVLDAGEQCDDNNNIAGDGCYLCMNETTCTMQLQTIPRSNQSECLFAASGIPTDCPGAWYDGSVVTLPNPSLPSGNQCKTTSCPAGGPYDFTFLECQVPTYACSGNSCILDNTNGTFTTSDCDNTCGFCGNGICDAAAGETCSTCVADCGVCATTAGYCLEGCGSNKGNPCGGKQWHLYMNISAADICHSRQPLTTCVTSNYVLPYAFPPPDACTGTVPLTFTSGFGSSYAWFIVPMPSSGVCPATYTFCP